MAKVTLTCPICRRPVGARGENAAFPFCSERCRTIDLGRWLGGEYRISTRSADEDEDGDARVERPQESDDA
jgi:endogenous inhibitor of DNA gyrase (YacG/DUF329 family)